MPVFYDNWERLVAAVLKKEQLWQLFHEQSRSPSISSGSSSGFSFCRLSSSLDELSFSFVVSEWLASSNQEQDDLSTAPTPTPTPSSILVKDKSPVENLSHNKDVTSKPPRKRDLKIQVPKQQTQDRVASSRDPESTEYRLNISLTAASPSLAHSSRVHPRAGVGQSESQTKLPHESYPLPLPPAAIPSSSHASRPNSAPKSPSAPLSISKRADKVKSPGTHWIKGKLLSSGALGDMYLGFNSEKGEMCAMKEVTLSSDDAESKQSARMLEKEIELWSRLKHPNIVQYYGSEMMANNFYIYLEYVSGGSIYDILQEYGRLGESAIQSYTQQILSGLAYLHSKSIAHRDIKGANILVDPNGRVKLANFGTEKHIAGRSYTAWLMESRYWMAPEVIMNPNVRNLTVDIWSLGCTVLEMATSKPPMSQYDRAIDMFKIPNHKELPLVPDHLSDECKDFLRHCLQLNPLHRAKAYQLLEHPFVKSSSPLGKRIRVTTFSGHPTATITVKSESIGHARNLHQLDSGNLAEGWCMGSKSNLHSRNISAPVSPDRSPLLHPRSPQHMNERLSPRLNSVDIYAPRNISAPVSPDRSPLLHPKSPQHMNEPLSARLNSVDIYAPRNISAPVSPDRSPLLHPRSPQHMNERLSPCINSVDIYAPRNISAAVSPDRSPLLHPRSPQHMNEHLSPLLKFGPCTASSSSTPLACGVDSIPYSQSKLPQETFRNLPMHSPSINSPSYWDPIILQGVLRFS